MKIKIKIINLLTLIIVTILICPLCKDKVITFANTDKVKNDICLNDEAYDVEIENEIVNFNSEIHLIYNIALANNDYDILIESTNFVPISRVVESEEQLDVYVKNNHVAGEYMFDVIVEHNGEETMSHTTYIYSNGVVDCVGLNDIEESKDIYFKNFILTEEQKEILDGNEFTPIYYELEIQYETFVYNERDIEYTVVKSDIGENVIQVVGKIDWLDINNINHPLINNYVYLNEKNNIISEKESKTDENGNFEFIINNNEIPNGSKLNLYISLKPITDAAHLGGIFRNYTYTLEKQENIVTYKKINYDIVIKSEKSRRASAYQIPQSMNYVRNYIKELSNMSTEEIDQKLPQILVLYPTSGEGCYYNDGFKYIGLEKRAYNSWDPCMHEYGHYVDDMFGITYPAYGDHSSNQDLISKYGKEKGLKLAYSEAIATYLGMSAQLYYNLSANNIPYVGDYIYDSYTNSPSVKTPTDVLNVSNVLKGEPSEDATIGLLLTLADSVEGRTYDKISIGYRIFWNIIKRKRRKNISELLNDVINDNSDWFIEGKIGLLLEHFGFSPKLSSPLESLDTVPENNNFEWTANGLDKYSLIFYSENLEEFYQIDNITTLSYKPTVQELHNIFALSGDTLHYQVAGYNTNTFTTGPYYSEIQNISKPLNGQVYVDTEYNLSISNGEIQWYKFKAPKTGVYEFYTTGIYDTCGELSNAIACNNELNNSILVDDNSGVGNNFKIQLELEKNKIIYIRITEKNSQAITNFIFKVICTSHDHIYEYKMIDKEYHILKCECGQTSGNKEKHLLSTTGHGTLAVGKFATCIYCKASIRIDDGGFYPIILGNKVVCVTFKKDMEIYDYI